MHKKLGILVVHGMGSQKADFADPMIEELENRLESRRLDPDAVEWRSVWWAPILDKPEADLWRNLKRGNNLDYGKLRRFVIHALGDAVAYRRVPRAGDKINVYGEIHGKVKKEIAALRKKLRAGRKGQEREAPLILIAHSLGCHIMSNYIWDRQKRGARSLGNDFEDLKTLTAILTFGCNMALFTLAHRRVVPIRFPLKGLARYFPSGTSPEAIRKASRWRNYYDPDDILGYPLKPLSAGYAKAVYQDVDINVGGPFTSWNPMSHGRYWTDNSFTKPAAKAIGDVLKLL